MFANYSDAYCNVQLTRIGLLQDRSHRIISYGQEIVKGGNERWQLPMKRQNK